MISLLAAVAAGVVIARARGHVGPWPWRVIDLLEDVGTAPDTVAGPAGRPRGSQSTHRVRRGGADEVRRNLPQAIDLLRVAISSGQSLHEAVEAVGRYGKGPVCEAFAAVHLRCRAGGALADEVSSLPHQLGPSSRAICATLVMAIGSGAPLAPALQRLSDVERRRIRRHTEERVRRLPVLLLGPLMGLILPAFVLLTIVPVLLAVAN